MLTRDELEERLQAWAQQQALDVERVVSRMEAGDYARHARVLRCEYAHPVRLPIEIRLHNLRRAGLHVSRAGYYDLLAVAKAAVSGALSRSLEPA